MLVVVPAWDSITYNCVICTTSVTGFYCFSNFYSMYCSISKFVCYKFFTCTCTKYIYLGFCIIVTSMEYSNLNNSSVLKGYITNSSIILCELSTIAVAGISSGINTFSNWDQKFHIGLLPFVALALPPVSHK